MDVSYACGVASFRVAGVALRDIQTCFVTCRKSFCVAGRNTFTALQFRGRRSSLSFRVAGAARCVFLRVALAGLRQVATDKVQIPWQAWHFVRYAEN